MSPESEGEEEREGLHSGESEKEVVKEQGWTKEREQRDSNSVCYEGDTSL